MTPPTVKVEDFGAKGDGVTDDTDAINKAISSLTGGGTVIFQSGKTYQKRHNLVVSNPGVKLWGYGATVYSVVTDPEIDAGTGVPQLSILLLAPRTGVYGLTLVSNLRTRLVGHPNDAAIYLESDGQEVADNRVEYGDSGVVLIGATNFLVARNIIYRTWADGIHISHDTNRGLNAQNGRVVCNVVRQTGDDMIAVVNYGIGEPVIGNFLIEGNDLAGEYWGRGIAVAGGRDVTIRKNKIANTARAAAIYINSEVFWKTANVRNVLIEENEIHQVQTVPPAYDPLGVGAKTGQGAIDINGQSAVQQVSQVLARKNLIDKTYKDGIFVRGNSVDIGLVDNTMGQLGRYPINIDASPDATVTCTGNVANGFSVTNNKCKSTAVTVTGAQF